MSMDAHVPSHAEHACPAPADLGELVRRAQANPRAFEALYELYLPPIYRFVVTQVRSVAEAEDITSATFERALRQLGTYQHRGPFDAWLFRIAVNCVRHQARQTRRQGQDPLSLADDVAARDDTEDEVLRMVGEENVRRLVRQLPQAQRQALMLMIMDDLRPREIARIIGKREGTVRVLLHRALRALREVSPHG